jgi:hypothetical protein
MKIQETNIEELISDKNRLVTERVAARILGLSYQSLKRSIRSSGRIPFYRMNSRISYRVLDLEEYIRKCRIPAKN